MLCVHRPTSVLYAMKVVPKAKIKTQKQTNQIMSELKILKSVEPHLPTHMHAYPHMPAYLQFHGW